ncbi:hypothetical protein CENDO_04990 [Corynebacterium endometrii]|uniref:Membrane protein YkvI n=2 Tax=Corynebacterium endometrii TaxID=2488819 RepID=A0A4P7QHQ1_9CORY|nr:hypothetical protein [Corynebacterium endometrii]QCB28287.1 hypothetical protein CENDO_04990 [Corynebacterium endometrii]
MSFVGLLVGAGFATGQEVVQYFTSFGLNGVWGIIVAGIIMTLAGTVFLQLGSYFNAQEHNSVFRKVTHPWVSRFLDICVIVTLFAVGFVMLAGAGSTLEQQFGVKAWIGSLIMLGLVLVCGMLDVSKVSRVIGAITPLIIVAVVLVAIYTAFNMPNDIGAAVEASSQLESPIGNWLVSALNYNGLALLMAVSMTLVIGGDHVNPREAGFGGILGGIIYFIMMALAGFSLMMNVESIGDSDIPMLMIVDSISPTLGAIMALIIYLMVFNTAIGMFYALGKRLAAGRENRYRVIFVVVCLAGFGLSFLGFKTLMGSVYPILGYLGIVMVAVLVVAWVKSLADIKDEATRRERIKALLHLKLHPDKEYDQKFDEEIGENITQSNMDDEQIFEDIRTEVAEELDADDSVNFDMEKFEEKKKDVEYYTDKAGE